MRLKNQQVGEIYRITDVPENSPCNNCTNCLRLRLLEFGFLPGTKIGIQKHNRGLWLLNILNEYDIPQQSIALREEEAERILFEDGECSINLV